VSPHSTSDRPPSTEARYGGRLMFSQSWEDPACDLEWLAPAPGSNLLAITSGGDNVLEFLLTDPAMLHAIDINPAQTYLMELKLAAFRHLTYPEMLELLGVRPSGNRKGLYLRVRESLSAEASAFWDEHGALIAQDLLTSGRFERYFAILRSVLRVLVGRRRMQRLFDLAPEDQEAFFRKEWDTRRWRAFLRIVCSKWFLGRRLDPSWFAHSEGPASFGDHFGGLARHAITQIPARTNYFLAQIFLGRYISEQNMPRYLLPESFAAISERVDRVVPVTADIREALSNLPPGSVDAFALSNVFEYSAEEVFAGSTEEIVRVARPRARLTLRNLIAPRRLALDRRFSVDEPISRALRKRDRGFIYSHFEAARLR